MELLQVEYLLPPAIRAQQAERSLRAALRKTAEAAGLAPLLPRSSPKCRWSMGEWFASCRCPEIKPEPGSEAAGAMGCFCAHSGRRILAVLSSGTSLPCIGCGGMAKMPIGFGLR